MSQVNPAVRGPLRVLTGFGAFGLFWGAWGALVPTVQAQTRATDGALGSALLMVGLGALLSMRATGLLIDRYGGSVLPLTAGLLALCGALPGLVHTPLALGAALLLLGASSGALDVALNAAGVAEEAASTRPLMNLAHASFSASVVLASLFTGGLRALGLGPGAVLLGVAGLITLVALLFLRGGPAAAHAPPSSEARSRTWRWPPVTLRVLGGLTALAFVVENAWQSWGAVHLSATPHASPWQVSAVPAVFASCAALGRLLGHRLAHHLPGPVLLGGGALLAALGSAVAALALTVAGVLGGIALAGLGTSVCAPTLLSLTGAWAGPHRRASALSTVTTLAYSGFLVGPAVVGWVAERTRLSTALLGVAGLAVLLAILTLPLARSLRSSASSPRPEV